MDFKDPVRTQFFGGASDFSNLLAPWASGSRSLMLRAGLGLGFWL